MEQIDSLQNTYLKRIKYAEDELKQFDTEYHQQRKEKRKDIAELIEEAKHRSDLSVEDIAKHLGKSRQALNKALIDVFGVRHPDKSSAAKIGHINRNAGG